MCDYFKAVFILFSLKIGLNPFPFCTTNQEKIPTQGFFTFIIVRPYEIFIYEILDQVDEIDN